MSMATVDTVPRDDVLVILCRAIARAGSQDAWAREIGISPQYLSDMLHGRRELSDAVLAPVGLARRTVFVRRP